MFRIICLICGSVLTAVFLILMYRGSQYDYMLEPLDEKRFPAKAIYSAGLYLDNTSAFSLRGSARSKLMRDAQLFYSKQYSEFYAHAVWAQMLSFTIMIVSLFLLLAGMFGGNMGIMLLAVGVITAALLAAQLYSDMGNMVRKRTEECEMEFPNAISKLAMIVGSGVILHDAWNIVAYGKDGEFYKLMQHSCEEMKNGKPDVQAIYDFGEKTNSDDIKKFTSALIQSMERGGGDLPRFLVDQSASLWELKRQKLLQKGEKAAGALLAPIGIMFVGVILIIVAASLSSLNI